MSFGTVWFQCDALDFSVLSFSASSPASPSTLHCVFSTTAAFELPTLLHPRPKQTKTLTWSKTTNYFADNT